MYSLLKNVGRTPTTLWESGVSGQECHVLCRYELQILQDQLEKLSHF
jgi:hypothetical protein